MQQLLSPLVLINAWHVLEGADLETDDDGNFLHEPPPIGDDYWLARERTREPREPPMEPLLKKDTRLITSLRLTLVMVPKERAMREGGAVT